MTGRPDVSIVQAKGAADLAAVERLFREYQIALNVDLEFQNFSKELATLPGAYTPPGGRLLLGLVDGDAAACIALRPFADATCEMKRLFVRPAFRRYGLGRMLCDALIAEARLAGYTRMLLDTLPSMAGAQALYERLGFKDVAPYRFNPVPGARFMALDLEPRDGSSTGWPIDVGSEM